MKGDDSDRYFVRRCLFARAIPERQVKRGFRNVRGEKILEEKLGRNELCPCGSGKRLKKGCF